MKIFTCKSLLIVFFTIITLSVKALTAGFTVDNASGCSPLVVHFHNTSSGATSYSWDLGNGTTSFADSCSGSYLIAGTYTVTLTAYGAGGATSVHTMVITVYPSPTVSFYASDTSVCPGTPVTFTSTTVAGVAGPLTYVWSFGDGTTSTSSSPTHTYPGPGYYTVTLFATNSTGCHGSLTMSSYIHVTTPPAATFSAATTFFCHAPGVAVFSSFVTGTPGYTYAWSFGDGNTSTAANPTNSYSTFGTYTVSLIVTDGNGCKDTITRPNYITVNHLTAAFSAPTTACMYQAVMFHNHSSTHTSSTWSFGDGGTSWLDSVAYIYHAAGTYNVRLIVADGPCADTVIHTITILPQPTSTFTCTPTEPCPAPVAVTYIGTVPGGSSVAWAFGDGHTGSGTTSTNTYSLNGVYNVRMIVTDVNGCIDTVYHTETIYNLRANMIDTPSAGCVPLTVHFSQFVYTTIPSGTATTYPYPISSYAWTFGDGSTGAGATPVHTYTAAGTYFVYCTITTSNGCTVTDTGTIHVGTPPIANFYATPTHECFHNNSIQFISTSTGTITDYKWTYGDGGIDSCACPTPTHHYPLPGIFTVTLIVYNNGCPSAPFTISNYITIDSPKSVIRFSPICVPPTTVNFVDSASIGATWHEWYFGDGTSSTANNPTHNYPALGIYTVTLVTYNSRSGCRDTATASVNLFKPLPHFTASDTQICKYGYTVFTPTVTGGTAAGYYWFVNGVYMEDTTAIYGDTFYVPGIYTISLVILDSHGCFDTVTRTNYITVGKPADSFSATPVSGCWPLTVTFTDHTTDVTGLTLTGYQWAFGDGTSTTTTSTTTVHTYTAAGTYGVTEIVTDNIGCKDTLLRTPLITVYRPHAIFTASNTTPCRNIPITFNNLSTGIVSSYWMFGDGDTSTLTSPTHAYAFNGSYTVKLAVVDIHGCTDTAVYVNYINVTAPHASFTMDDSFTVCPPLTVHFINTSTGAIGCEWFLGDGSTSFSTSPSNLYITPGYDTVMLIEANAAGCRDTAFGHIDIFGYAGAFTYGPLRGCSPLTVTFHANIHNVPNIIWDYADGNTSTASLADSSVHVYVLPGAYIPKLILSDNTGCQNSSMGTDTIKVDLVTPGFTTMPNPVCLNTPINFKDTSKSFFSTITSWHWTINGLDTSDISNPPYIYSVTGTFAVSLTVTDGWGCTGNVTENITVFPPPVITVSPDTIVCLGDAATLIGYGGVSYTWSPGATLSCTACTVTQASPTVVTQYTVTGTDIHGCQNTDTVSVFLKTKTISTAHGDAVICDGVNVQLTDSGATKFTWIPSTGLSADNIWDPVATPHSNTVYTVIAQLGSCIPDTNYVTIVVHPLPQVNAGPDQLLLAGSVAQLNATGNLINTYSWSPAQTLSCDSCSNPKASMQSTTTYTVTVATVYSCTATDSVTIRIYCDDKQLFIPNTFTPNGDGQNDVFYPRGTGVSIIKSFRIYNRWGELLFERSGIAINDMSNAWDGSYMGGKPRPDVYVYIIDATCEAGAPLSIKGDVTILK